MEKALQRSHDRTAGQRIVPAASVSNAAKKASAQAMRFDDRRASTVAQRALMQHMNNWQGIQQQQPAADAAAVVQRYKKVGAFTHEKQDERPMFTEQDLTLSLNTNRSWKSAWTNPNHSLDYKQQAANVANVGLLVAEDDSMAINNTKKEPKEFYADPNVVKTANAKLENVHSTVRLFLHNNTITVAGKKLQMVTGGQQRMPDEPIEDLLNYECYRVASEVMGMRGETQSDLMLGTPEQQRSVEINPTGQEETKVNRLGRSLALSTDNRNVKTAAKHMENGPQASYEEAKTYGTRSGKNQLNKAAKTLGINQHAQAGIGEAYAIYTQKAEVTSTHDYSRMQKKAPSINNKVWGYHYAGVVAKSHDGKDSVTLENYNRRDDVRAQVPAIRAALLQRFHKKLSQHARQQIGLMDHNALFNLHLQGGIYETFRNEYVRILESAKLNQAWYFAMYGSKKGQTFHERQAATGTVSNPITVRVKKRLAEAKEHWKEELDAMILALGNYCNDHHDTVSTYITQQQIIQKLTQLNLVIAGANSHKALDNAKLLIKAKVLTQLRQRVENEKEEASREWMGNGGMFDFSDKSEHLAKFERLIAIRSIVARMGNMP